MFGHSAGPQQPLLHGGTHHAPYGGAGHHNHHHNSHHHHHHHHQQQYHHHPHHPHHTSHHTFHHGHSRHWYRPWVSFNFRPAPIVQPPLPHTHADIVVVEPSRRFSFLRAIIYTILIWLLLGALFSSLRTDWVWGYHAQLALPQKLDVGPGNANLGYPIPSGVTLTSCETPMKDSGGGDATIEIPSSSDAVLLFSDGHWLYGPVQITTTSTETDSIKFSVSLSSRRGLPSDTIVCSLERGDGEAGVGIFNPEDEKRDPNDAIHYSVSVELPENHPVVKRFESHVINSRYDIEDLQGKILFENLSLHGSNGGIYVKSIATRWADISTSNGPIEGYFNASDFLKVQTSNGWLDVDVDFSQDTSDKAVLSLLTSNGPLKADLHLHDAATSRSTPANFDVTTQTANSPLNVAFLDAPVDSLLSLQASTAVSPAEVTLHPTFEGHFSLSSTILGVAVHRRPAVEDPSGKGRHRLLNYRSVRGRIDGDVFWGEGPHEERGNVEVSSSVGRVTLNL